MSNIPFSMISVTRYRDYTITDGMKVRLPQQIFIVMQEQIAKHYPNECGGILVGHIEGDTATVENIIIPTRFLSSPVFFRRMASFINKCLQKIFKQSNGKTIYLGEWHSHPDGWPVPSSTDCQTMRKIAQHDGVRIQTPLLLIISYDRKIYNEKFYLFSNENMIPYEKQKLD